MTLVHECIPCQHGQHDAHQDVVAAGVDGLIGSGQTCPCRGECVDRRPFLPDGVACDNPASGYVFLTWRAALKDSHERIADAYEKRRRTFRAAADAGLSRREIGEAVGLSAAAVQKIIGKDAKATLDDRAGSPASALSRLGERP